ncbi:MAG TPA: sulfite exporter TauE/SafE family protein [Anaeromyxobacteraceae bacterium]|nr:sulfite exporter TauE/SafE family protein [Anaeromyxobacteraceae bacterium]
MSLFLPIAQASVSIPLMVAAGGMVGLLSGLFGVGGGFLLTPLLMFMGISPVVAAASGSAAILAAATTGTLEHSRASTVDFKLGFTLFAGGAIGSVAGVELLHWLNRFGPANSVIRVLYVVMLGTIGTLMLVESIRTWRRGIYMSERRFQPLPRRSWTEALPGAVRFPKSEIEVSFLLPVAMGVLGGVLAALMGVGGGFVMVPLMLYVLRMRMHVVVGTSLFQILFTSGLVTVLQAAQNHTVDCVLALLLATGSTAGAVIGTRWGRRLRADQLKILLALIVLGVAVKVTVDTLRTPSVLLSHVAGE